MPSRPFCPQGLVSILDAVTIHHGLPWRQRDSIDDGNETQGQQPGSEIIGERSSALVDACSLRPHRTRSHSWNSERDGGQVIKEIRAWQTVDVALISDNGARDPAAA